MGIFLSICGIVGWWFILSLFTALHETAFHALNTDFSWFAILFLVGSVIIARVGLGIK